MSKAPGVLVYLVGASGVGKDALLAELRKMLKADEGIMVAQRYITRPQHQGHEKHIALKLGEFTRLQAAGGLALHWESHGLHYGVGRELERWLAQGLIVVVNGSRQNWPQVQERFAAAQLVEIVASEEILRQRLLARGRDSAAEIEARLEQHRQLTQTVLPIACSIRNESTLIAAASELRDWLLALRQAPVPHPD